MKLMWVKLSKCKFGYKTYKRSKKHLVWEFTLDDENHKLEMFDSLISGKKKVIKNSQVIKEADGSGDSAFTATFSIGKHNCTLIQHGEGYELRIDNQSFNHVMDLEKNKLYFGKDSKGPISVDIQSGSYSSYSNQPRFGINNISNTLTKKEYLLLITF